MRTAIWVLSVIALATCAAAEPPSDWVYVGTETPGVDDRVFVKMNGVEDWGDGNFYVPKLTVYPSEIAGIDKPDGAGGVWVDTTKPYLSLATMSIYDCNRRLIAVAERNYFSTDTPSSKDLVYLEKDPNPRLYPEPWTDPVFNAVCR